MPRTGSSHMEESYDLDLATRATSSTVERDSDSCSITSLLDGYYCYSLPTIEEENVEMDDPDVLEDEDVEIFWRGILKPGHNRRRTVYEEHTPEEEMDEDEDDILTRRMSLSRRNHGADSSNVTSFFSSCSTVDECPEDVVRERSGREDSVQSVSTSESDIHDYLSPSTSISTPSTPIKPKHPKPSSSKPNFLSTPPARKSPKLLSPLTKLPKRLSESLSSISLPYSSRRKSSSSHKFLPHDLHRNTESPPTLDIRASPEFHPQLPETPRYSKYSNHDSWTSTISTPSLQYSTVSSLSSSPISSPMSASFSRSFPPSESIKENPNSNFVGLASPSSMSGFKSSFTRRKPVPDFDDDDTRSWLPEMMDVGGFRSTAPLRIVKRRGSREQSLSN